MADKDHDLSRLLRAAGPRREPSPEALERMRAAVHAEWKASVLQRRTKVWGLAAAASLVFLAIAAGLFFFPASEPPASVARILEHGREARIVHHERGAAALGAELLGVGDEVIAGPGGLNLAQVAAPTSTIRLEAGTRARWLSATELQVLVGGVYVDTGRSGAAADHSQGPGLTLLAGDARISHVGTQFMIRTTPAGTRVQVRDGLVRIVRGEHSETLGRGESALLTAGATQIEKSLRATSGSEWTWADALSPRVEIEGQDLKGVLLALAYHAGLQLEFSDAGVERQIAQTTLHGPALTLPPARALRALLETTPFTVAEKSTAEGDQIIVGSH